MGRAVAPIRGRVSWGLRAPKPLQETPAGAPPTLGALRGESGRPLRGRVSRGLRAPEPLRKTPAGGRPTLRPLRGESGRPLRGRVSFGYRLGLLSTMKYPLEDSVLGGIEPPRPLARRPNYHACALAASPIGSAESVRLVARPPTGGSLLCARFALLRVCAPVAYRLPTRKRLSVASLLRPRPPPGGAAALAL